MKRNSVGYRLAHNILKSGRFRPVLGLTGYYITAPGYFAGNVNYAGFFLHHCIHYMDLVSFLVSPVTGIAARKVEKTPGRVLFHVAFDFACGAIGTIAMGTIHSRGTPVERLELMGDHQRLEVEDVVEVRWHRNPPFKTADPAATLADDQDTLIWKPNFTAAANEDQGLLRPARRCRTGFARRYTPAPTIHDGVIAMERLETMRRALDL
jgi:myo-inositol 2-dehydrogenase/D-chiro-inositol 1-dehydrogenase